MSTSLWLMANNASSRRVDYAGLVEDVRQVALHGLFADGELLGDVALRAAFDDAADDFEFARREAVGLLLGHGRGLLHQVVQRGDQVDDALAADPVVAGEHGPQAFTRCAGHGVLEHDAACADLQRFDDLLGGDGWSAGRIFTRGERFMMARIASRPGSLGIASRAAECRARAPASV